MQPAGEIAYAVRERVPGLLHLPSFCHFRRNEGAFCTGWFLLKE
jgi:hypothetical protein